MSSPPSSLTLVAINVQVFSALLLARPQYPLRSVAVQRLPLPPVCSCPRLVPFLPLAPLAPLLLLLLQPCLSRAPAELALFDLLLLTQSLFDLLLLTQSLFDLLLLTQSPLFVSV